MTKWSVVSPSLSRELQAFKGAHNRVRDGKSPYILWPRTLDGFAAFLKEAGQMPAGMVKPSLGRILHKFGYETGNIQWEEHRFNSVKRRGTKHEGETSPIVELKTRKFKRGTPEHLAHQAAASAARWAKEGQREKMSKFMKGNKHAVGNKVNSR